MIGETGGGSGNYLHLSDMYYDVKERTVNVIDAVEMARYRYTLAGEFIGKEEFDFPWVASVTYSGNDYMMISHTMTGGSPGPAERICFYYSRTRRKDFSSRPVCSG